MWECALCRKRLFTNSGIHQMIRTASGHDRLAGLCAACAAYQDNQASSRALWCTLLIFSGISLSASVLSFVFLVPK